MAGLRGEPNRTLLLWGANSYGQLGLGHKEDVLLPQALKEFAGSKKTLKNVAGGGGHSAVITDTGELFLCGQNKNGQLGLNHTEDVLHFTLCSSLSGCPVVQVACGWDFSIILTESGHVLSCGSNSFGQLGIPHTLRGCSVPQKIESLKDNVVNVAAGLRHALAATENGSVFQWGTGMVSHAKRTCQGKIIPSFLKAKEPCKVTGLENIQVKNVTSGSHHAATLTETGKTFTWGRGDYGQLGRNGVLYEGQSQDEKRSTVSLFKESSSVPVAVPSLTGATEIACGSEHNVAIIGSQCFSWGWNEHGMCGNGTEANVYSPEPISALSSGKLLLIGCGAGHSIAYCDFIG